MVNRTCPDIGDLEEMAHEPLDYHFAEKDPVAKDDISKKEVKIPTETMRCWDESND